jgi:hypothetical protein
VLVCNYDSMLKQGGAAIGRVNSQPVSYTVKTLPRKRRLDYACYFGHFSGTAHTLTITILSPKPIIACVHATMVRILLKYPEGLYIRD